MNIAVFASGSGSNFQAIMEDNKLAPHIQLLVTDQPKAKVIERAKQYNLATFVFSANDYSEKQLYEEAIYAHLKKKNIDFIVLAGYMRLIGKTLLTAYPKKIINLHPSLLPRFKGRDAIRQALQAKATETGVTAHFIDSGMDTGPIIAQEKIVIFDTDDETTLTNRIHKVEHQFYPRVIKQFI